MKTLTYVGPHQAVSFDQGGVSRTVARGESVRVTDSAAEGLLEQPDNWAEAQAPTKTTEEV